MPVYRFSFPAEATGKAFEVRTSAGVVVDTIAAGASSGSVSTVVAASGQGATVVSSVLDVGSYVAVASDERLFYSASAPGVLDVSASLGELPATIGAVVDPVAASAKTALRLGVYRGLPSLNDAIVSMATPPTGSVTGPGGTGPITGTTTTQSTTLVTRREGRYSTSTINSVGYHNNRVNDPSSSRSQCVIEFQYTGATFAVRFLNQFAATSGVRVIVDGQLAGVWYSPVGSTTSQPYWLQITFAAAAPRRFRLEFLTGAIFGGLNYADGALSPIPGRLPKCAVYGDSWVGGALDVLPHELYYYQLGRELGWETARLGHGGSGYGQDGTGDGVEYENAARVAELALYSPDFAVIFGSINNDATAESTVEAAATSLYAQIAAASPHTRVIVVGPPPLATAVPAGRLASRDAVARAAAAAPNVVQFIDPIAEAWITDANAATWIGSDGSHPTPTGHKGIATLTAKAILRVAED